MKKPVCDYELTVTMDSYDLEPIQVTIFYDVELYYGDYITVFDRFECENYEPTEIDLRYWARKVTKIIDEHFYENNKRGA